MIRFLHTADVHLGNRRYNLEERAQDFFRAWHDVIVNHAVPSRVDFVIISGDFFNARRIDPQTMNHAMIGLQTLREAGIPVVAIEGNHDQHEHDDVSRFSWMRSLSQWGFLKLLEPSHDEEGRMALVPWDEDDRAGSYIDIKGARIFGSHWYGTSAHAAMGLLADAVRRARQPGLFHVLMLHTDIEGQLKRPIPALSVERLKELRSLVEYVALGHTHKRFEVDNWAFNPGSLEACSIDEYREERGFYLVEVDDAHNVTAKHVTDYVQRPFQRLSFDVSGVADPEAVHAGVMELVGREARRHDPDSDAPAPIVEISLKGHLGFKNSLLDVARIRDESRALTGALHVMVRNQSVPVEYAVAAGLDGDTSRHIRERRIIEDLIARDNRFRERAPEMAALVLEAKRRVLGDDSPAEILDFIEQQLDSTAARRDNGDAETSRVEALAAGDADAEPEIAAPASALHALERNATT
ncbi:MAG TPA: exonuclease SbcCD subunit D [Pyrinomonadaceae bacterium]|nr:exonuclease SbcCD subunit D [Pyrinomonadaceae bacterium]